MLKRMVLLIVVLLFPTLTYAQNELSGAAQMAQYFPASTAFFTAFATDESVFNALNDFSETFLSISEAGGTAGMSLRASLNAELAKVDTDVDSVLAWLGDYAAIGVSPIADTPAGGSEQTYLSVVQIEDRAEAESFIENAYPQATRSTRAGFTVFSASVASDALVAVGDDLLFLYTTNLDSPLEIPEDSLASNDSFVATVGALPEASYNALIYTDPAVFTEDILLDPSGEFTLTTAPLAVGVTMLDERTSALDTAQLPVRGAEISSPAAIDPDFSQYIPGNTSTVIHATNLSELYSTIIGFADSMNSTQSSMPSAQTEQLMEMLGFDLENDLLSWMTGDYALFYSLDTLELAPALIAGAVPDIDQLNNSFAFGLVVEATDSDKAQALATRLGMLFQLATSGQENVSVDSETISGVDVTVLTLNTPLDAQNTFSLDILVGATEDVFFLATRPQAETIISGDGMLSGNRSYNEALDYMLPNPTAVWYADGEGLFTTTAVGTVIPLALLGPAIGAEFDSIVAELQATPTAAPKLIAPTSIRQTQPVDPQVYLDQIEKIVEMISSSSFSATVNEDGVSLLRFVFTLDQ